MRIAALMLALSIPGAMAAAAPEPQASFSIGWKDCLAGRQQTFFTLDFRPDGTVTFDGKADIREMGVRVARIDPRRLQRLLGSATRAVRPDAPRAETSPYESRPIFCLEVRVTGPESSLAGLISPHGKPGKRLHRQLLRYLDLKTWVCPTKAAPGEMAGCDRPESHFTYSERENCYRFGHHVSLWRDGRVHYYAHGLPGSDRYYAVDPSVFQRLLEIGSRYQGEILVTHSRPNPRHRYLVGREMLIEYKRYLSELANVPWQPLPVSSGCE
jgi:hypothetical protein